MEKHSKVEDEIVGATHGVVSHNLDSVEAGVDQAIDGTKEAVHELRNEAQQVVDRMLSQLKQSWEEQRPKVEHYVASHPWVILGGVLLFAYLIAGGTQRSRSQ